MTAYYDYLIVLSPPENIINRVKKLKGFSFKKIGDYESFDLKAHIPVQYWPRKKTLWVEPFIPKLERELQLLPKVELTINGFDFFKQQSGKTIYAKLKSTASIDVWFNQLRKYFNIRHIEPHITITRSINEESFNTLWPSFKTVGWDEQFTIDKLTILKRATIGYDRDYKLFKEIHFNQKLDFNTFADAKIKKTVLSVKKSGVQQISLF